MVSCSWKRWDTHTHTTSPVLITWFCGVYVVVCVLLYTVHSESIQTRSFSHILSWIHCYVPASGCTGRGDVHVSVCIYIYISSLPLPVPAGHKGGASPGYLQRSRSDVDVNAATVAKQRHIGQVGPVRLSPSSYSSLGKEAVNQTRQPTNQTGSLDMSLTDRQRTDIVYQIVNQSHTHTHRYGALC